MDLQRLGTGNAGSVNPVKIAQGFRWIAMAEATSWLILIVATIVKYAADAPLGVQIMGPIHGVLFIVYVAVALVLWRTLHWSARTLLIVLVDSILPTGGFFVAARADLARSASASSSR
jgi:integral membrane protein